MTRIVVIGAGVGGLAAAAVLARAGLDVTVLEAHIYPGGCAGTFYHQGYRFDAGATLAAGFYPGGPMDLVGEAAGGIDWPVRAADPAMVVHLPRGEKVARLADDGRWTERRRAFGAAGEAFWQWQESAADAVWDLALRQPPWPPQTARDALHLAGDGACWLAADLSRLRLGRDVLRSVSAHLRGVPDSMRFLVDGQLLISAQTTADHAVGIYGAAALDLPRRQVVHAAGGMGAIAQALADAVRRNGGAAHLRHEATRIVAERGRPVAVETRRGEPFPASIVITNLPPWNVARLLGDGRLPRRLKRLPPHPRGLWGAFVVYAGVDASVVPGDFPLHHQVVRGAPAASAAARDLDEVRTLFLSMSPAWDAARAPEGRRAVTLSSHTDLDSWWTLFETDRPAYEARRDALTARALEAAEVALPGMRDAAGLVLPGTPVTFQRFTRRVQGWVGGFPQTSLTRAWGPRLGRGLWLVGDSIFPGQSVPAVALGGLRVARAILAEEV
ncbi:MAG: FAD-dependent oxidoreductase [Anaerolineae bacterium]|nr:FAD-dependent oxidoreductase [Anaerolineae bacterium]